MKDGTVASSTVPMISYGCSIWSFARAVMRQGHVQALGQTSTGATVASALFQLQHLVEIVAELHGAAGAQVRCCR